MSTTARWMTVARASEIAVGESRIVRLEDQAIAVFHLADGTAVRRYPLRTDLYAREDDLEAKTLGYIERFFAGLPTAGPDHAAATAGRWYFFISEKIVAITQGRSFFIWDIKVGRPARVLSRWSRPGSGPCSTGCA